MIFDTIVFQRYGAKINNVLIGNELNTNKFFINL